MKSFKVAIVCALLSEAESLIENFGLKISSKKPFLIFENDKISLIISGMGKINSAVAASFILQQKNFTKILNIGICASKKKEDLYKIFQIKGVIDISSSKKYILKKEGEIISTLDKPLSNPSIIPSVLADMESSGFLNAAKKFIPSKEIEILKIVSDNFDEKIPEKEFVKELIRSHIKKIEEFL